MISSLALLADICDYKKPHLSDNRECITNLYGIDSEAYKSGQTFMICTSEGDVMPPDREYLEILFRKYPDSHFGVYNIKYDSGAFLQFMPKVFMYELWKFNETRYLDYHFRYIPHKALIVKAGKIKISFWDISQFYKQKLDNAAKKYLGEQKMEMRTKSFSERYVSRYYNHIAKYCIKDARLTRDLLIYLVDKLMEFGIVPSSLYSCASISFKYFCNHSKVNHVWHQYKYNKPLLAMASDAYRGGKFEVTARGSFTGHEYDLTSAYPYEIANLYDINNADLEYTRDYQPGAVYGFIQCRIDNTAGKYLPCGVNTGTMVYYPQGIYHATITKAEYEYLLEIGIPVQIYYAAWLFIKKKVRLYKNPIFTLFDLKSSYKNKDMMLYNTSKIVMNSFYGKLCQTMKDPYTGRIKLGPGWNPVHASVITANTRIKVTRIQNIMQDKCFALHTDSVMTSEPIPAQLIKDGLGEFELAVQGKSILIACGMYQMGRDVKTKGFKMNINRKTDKHDTWEDVLNRYPGYKKIPYPALHVESWVEAMAKGHPKTVINFFKKEKKLIDINCDTKRIWPSRFKARDFLEKFEHSSFRPHIEMDIPKHWKKIKTLQ